MIEYYALVENNSLIWEALLACQSNQRPCMVSLRSNLVIRMHHTARIIVESNFQLRILALGMRTDEQPKPGILNKHL